MNHIASLALWVLVVMAAYASISGPSGLQELYRLSSQVEELKTQHANIQANILKLEGNLTTIDNSEFLLEKKAREDLALSKPGDIVYTLSKGPTVSMETP